MYAGKYAVEHPDRPAFIMASTGQVVTYTEHEARCNRLAHLLRAHGLRRLDHYSVFMENNDRYLESCGAGERSGLYYTCVNSYLTADELAYILDNSESQVLITSRAKREVAMAAVAQCPRITLVLVVDEPGGSDDARVRDFAASVAEHPAAPLPDEQVGTYGNRISVMIVPIPTDEPDPVQRVMRAQEAMLAAKGRHKAMPAELLQDVTNFIPPAINARAARVALQLGTQQRMRPLYNLVISNVPGPAFPLYMRGAEVVANYPVSVVADGAGLNITVMSYRDSMDFGLIADRDQIPEIWDLMDALRRDLEAIAAAAGGG